jgi:hypothetical protein
MTALLHRSVPQVAALTEFAMTDTPPATSPARAPSSQRLEPLRRIDAGVLNIAYYEAGPSDGPAVMLLHGFPYDIHSYVDVAPQLAAQAAASSFPICAAMARPGFSTR